MWVNAYIIQKDFGSITYIIGENYKGKDERIEYERPKFLYNKEQHKTEK